MFLEYLFFISAGSSIILLLLSIMAFINLEGMKIQEGKNYTSGIMLLINCILYFLIALYIKIKISRNNDDSLEKRDHFKSGHLLEMPEIKQQMIG